MPKKLLFNFNREVIQNYTYVKYVGTIITATNTLEKPIKGAILSGNTGYRDIDTGEFLETFEEGRNLELVSVRMPVLTTESYSMLGLYTVVISNNVEQISNIRYKITHPGISGYYSAVIKTLKEFKQSEKYTINLRVINKSEGLKVDINKVWNSGIYDFKPDLNSKELQTFTFSPLVDNYEGNIFGIQLSGEQEKGLNIDFEFWITEGIDIKSNILTVNEDVTLRSNGDICDELNLLTGQLTQRIGEDGVVLSQEAIKTVDLSILDQNGNKVSSISSFNDTTHITASSETIPPIFEGYLATKEVE